MKLKHLLPSTLLASAGLVLLTQSAEAAGTYTNGDLFIGFRASGGTHADTSLVIDIGQASTYRDATGNFNLSIGSIGADLAAVYGPSWFTRTDLYWGIAGYVTPAVAGDGNRTLYASNAETTLGVQATAWNSGSNGSQAGPGNQLQAINGDYTTIGVTGSNVFVQTELNTNGNAWANLVTGGNAGQTFTGNSFSYFGSGIEGSSATGVGGTALDLFRLPVDGSGAAGSYEGTFKINSGGTISYSASVVPEPSTYALMAFGLLSLLMVARRRQRA